MAYYVTRRCSVCGYVNTNNTSICVECGYPVSAPAAKLDAVISRYYSMLSGSGALLLAQLSALVIVTVRHARIERLRVSTPSRSTLGIPDMWQVYFRHDVLRSNLSAHALLCLCVVITTINMYTLLVNGATGMSKSKSRVVTYANLVNIVLIIIWTLRTA